MENVAMEDSIENKHTSSGEQVSTTNNDVTAVVFCLYRFRAQINAVFTEKINNSTTYFRIEVAIGV